MSQEVINSAYNAFAETGYDGDIEKFKNLVSTDSEALDDAYSLVEGNGFDGTKEEFSSFFNVKKKDNLEQSFQEPTSESTSQQSTRKSLLDIGTQEKATDSESSLFIGNPPKGKKKKPVDRSVEELVSKYNYTKDDLDRIEKSKLFTDEKGIKADVSEGVFPKGDSSTKFLVPEMSKSEFNSYLKYYENTAKDKFKSASLTNEDLSDAEELYNTAKNGGDWWQKTKEIGADILNFVARPLWMSDAMSGGSPAFGSTSLRPKTAGEIEIAKPLDAITEKVKKEAQKSKQILSKDDLDERVKQEYIQELKYNMYHSKLNEVNSQLTDQEQYVLSKKREGVNLNLKKESAEALDVMEKIAPVTLKYKDELSKLMGDAQKLLNKGQDPTPEMIDRYEFLTKTIKENEGIFDVAKQKYNKTTDDINTIEHELSVLNTEQSRWATYQGRVGASVLGIASNVGEVIANTGGMFGAEGFETYVEGKADFAAQSAEDIRKKLRTTPTFESPLDYVDKATEIVGDNTAIVFGLTAAGAVGVGALAIESAGAKSQAMRKETEAENKKLKDAGLPTKELYSGFERYAGPILNGAATLLPMARQLKIIKGSSKVWQAIERDAPDLIKRTLKQKAFDFTKNYFKDSFVLGAELKIMALGQLVVDDYVLGKEDVDYTKAISDLGDFRNAGVLAGMNKFSGYAFGKAVKPYMSEAQTKIVDGNSKLMSTLLEKMNSGKISEAEKAAFKEQLDNLAKQSERVMNEVITKMSEMSEADYNSVINLAKKSSDMRNSAEAIKESKELSDADKKALLDRLKESYIVNEAALKNVVGNYTKSSNPFFQLKDREQQKLKDEASRKMFQERVNNGDKDFKVSDFDITKRAASDYENALKAKEANAPVDTNKPVETVKQAENVEEPRVQDSQIPLKRETFEYEDNNGDTKIVEVTTRKDGSRIFISKDQEGNTGDSTRVGKENTVTTEEYVNSAYGDIIGEPKVEQGNDIMNPKMKEKLTPEQKAELGIQEEAPVAENATTEENKVLFQEGEKPSKSKTDKEIEENEKDLDFYTMKVEDIQDEIKTENDNTKEGVADIKAKILEVRNDKSLTREQRADKIEDLKYEIENFKEEQEAIIESYKNDLLDAKAELKKAEKKSSKLKEKKSAEEAAKPKETPKAEPVKEQWEIDYERRKAKLDEFNAENRPSAIEDETDDRFEFKISDRQNSEERSKLQQSVFDAQQNISRADDTDAAIEEFNKKKKELQDFDDETQNMQNVRDINDLIFNEIAQREKDGDNYQYSEEFNKDPREAALKNQKDLIDFLEKRGNEDDLESIDRYKNDVKILEKDIKENPLKENTLLREKAKPTRAKRATKAEAAPTEEKFTIDGKEYTKEEAIQKGQNNSKFPVYGSKMEYNGNDPEAKRFAEQYNSDSNPYNQKGQLKGSYIQKQILKALDEMNFRKFGNLYRKHIDPYFKRSMNEKAVGGVVGKNFSFRDLAGYRIGDASPDNFKDAEFRAFAKEAGIEIPEFVPDVKPIKNETKPAEEVKPVEETKPSEEKDVNLPNSFESFYKENATKSEKKSALENATDREKFIIDNLDKIKKGLKIDC